LSFHYSDSIKEHDDGLAIISKYPIINNLFLPPVYGWSPGWLVTIKTPKGCLQVFNVHLNPKLVCENNIGLFGEGIWATSQFRLKEINYYYQFLNPKLPTIIAGDFNENDNCAVANYLCNRNFFDNLTLVPAYIKTWYWNAAGFVVTGRYDRIYNSPCLHTKYCRVVTKGDSDHFPVFVDYCY
jgi:endonuclease/exonuclease/phosphatase family metal-dependent hydrolase